MLQWNKEQIIELFKNEGFALVGFVGKQDCALGDWISPWIDQGYHAGMSWMEQYGEIRRDPSVIEDYTASILSAAINYKTEPPARWAAKNPISNYAWGEDYHLVLRKKLNRILAYLKTEIPGFKGRVCIDTAPLPEKIIAQRCGVGWIGKNSMLINRHFGSYLFLVEIVSNLNVETDKPTKNYCGTCRKCIDACPTKAIVADGVIDSNRCISYLTIEKRGDFSPQERSLIDYQIFGCDICQQVCPWNKKSPVSDFSPFACSKKWLDENLTNPSLFTVNRYNELKIKSPVKRSKFEGLIRNIRAISDNRRSS